MRLHYVRRLLGIQGYSIAEVIVEERRGRQAVVLEPGSTQTADDTEPADVIDISKLKKAEGQ
ncbi:MAG: hypothetical protein FJ143_01390 [Deltaproteobacteria bacterium]|nr:hypothetical protein [Deltaproteobacteria bacterium]